MDFETAVQKSSETQISITRKSWTLEKRDIWANKRSNGSWNFTWCFADSYGFDWKPSDEDLKATDWIMGRQVIANGGWHEGPCEIEFVDKKYLKIWARRRKIDHFLEPFEPMLTFLSDSFFIPLLGLFLFVVFWIGVLGLPLAPVSLVVAVYAFLSS